MPYRSVIYNGQEIGPDHWAHPENPYNRLTPLSGPGSKDSAEQPEDADDDASALRSVSYNGQHIGPDHWAHPHNPRHRVRPLSHPHDHAAPRAGQDSQDVVNLAKVIESEAGGEGEVAMQWVGWTVKNRMVRNNTKVDGVWGAFSHVKPPTPKSLSIARAIQLGKVSDPTNGATHFYTPSKMPGPGDNTSGRDVKGGIETIDGRKSYRPGFAGSPDFSRVANPPGLAERTFEFYRQDREGTVR